MRSCSHAKEAYPGYPILLALLYVSPVANTTMVDVETMSVGGVQLHGRLFGGTLGIMLSEVRMLCVSMIAA